MSIAEFCHWLQNTGWATALRESELMFPLLEGSHLLGITLSVGTLLMLDLRLAGILFRDRPVSSISRAVMPISLLAFAWMFLSGIVLFASQAEKAWGSLYFKLKLLFLLLAGLNALIFELTLRRRIHEWDRDPVPPPRARLAALLAMFFWAGVICAGRTMAYNF